jgi:mannose-6-phosphate isomerase-like protein (cupin superfamily)
MIVRNLRDKEVLDTTYLAHGGAIAQMVLDRRVLKEIGFLAFATLTPGKEIEAHVDPMEEIYFFLSGEGEMSVGEDSRHVVSGDAVWVTTGSSHSVLNSGEADLCMLVVAAPWWLNE